MSPFIKHIIQATLILENDAVLNSIANPFFCSTTLFFSFYRFLMSSSKKNFFFASYLSIQRMFVIDTDVIRLINNEYKNGKVFSQPKVFRRN